MDSDPTQEPGAPPASGRPRSAASRAGTSPPNVPSPAADPPSGASLPADPPPAPPVRGRALVEQELVNTLGWLVTQRWLAGLAVLVATFFATRVLHLKVPAGPLYAIGAAILAYNAALWWLFARIQRTRRSEARAFEWFARAQIGLDWVATTAIIVHSGGVDSPATIFFLFHIAIASLLLPHRYAFLYVTLPPLLVGGVAALEYFEVLPHVALAISGRYRDPVYVGAVLTVFTAACYVMAYFCMAIAQRLRRRESELGGLYDSVRDVSSTLEITDVLDRIVEAAGRVLGCRATAIRLIDRAGSQVEFAASWGLSEAYRDEVPEEYARSRLDQETIRDGVSHVRDVEHDHRVWHAERVLAEGIASMLSVSILGRSGPMGVLRAYGAAGHRFTDHDAAYLQAVAAHGAVAIENAKAYRLLADLDRDKSKFLRITTHELRSPVRVTESLLMTLADGYAGPLGADQAELVRRAKRRLASLHELIDDLLDLAAGKADMGRVERRVVDLGYVFAEVVDRFRPLAARKGITLDLVRPNEPLDVWCDVGDLERIAANLVGNAVKYTRQGGVTVSLMRDGERPKAEVVDTGIGIPSESMPLLFNEFYRAANAKAAEEGGTGLGLSIVAQLVARYAGQISVTSEEGRGSTFTVTLPPAEPAAAAIERG